MFAPSTTRCPIITAKSEQIDKVLGLELGGDDYIVKPFGCQDVLARVHAVARRCQRSEPIKEQRHEPDFTMDGWGYAHVPNSRTLDQMVIQLRNRIERDPKNPRIVQTVYGAGYRYEPEEADLH